jgi:hypothetical protein
LHAYCFEQENILKKAAEKAIEERERTEARALPSERIEINSERLEKAKQLREKQVSSKDCCFCCGRILGCVTPVLPAFGGSILE